MNKRNGRASSATTHQISRRTALKLFTAAPAAAVMSWTPLEAARAHERMQTAARQSAPGTPFKPAFFTELEYATVAVLVDLIIPKDERSGSASEAGVPQFIDFMMIDQPKRQVAMRGGLALIDHLCEERFANTPFVDCADAERRQILADIAFTGKVKPEHVHAAAFFASFRDLTASGFWTTKMGIDDLGYQGNTFVGTWKGCPDAALKKLGVAYGPDRE